MADAIRNLAERFLTPAEVATLFRRFKKTDNIEKVKDKKTGKEKEVGGRIRAG